MKERVIIGALKALSRLPLGLLYVVSDGLYLIVYFLVRYRKKVVRGNLTSSFPERTHKEIIKIEKAYYHFMCDMIFETLKLLTISPQELERRVKICHSEAVEDSTEVSKVVLLGHYGNWEWVQEIGRCFTGYRYRGSIYHPMSNKLSEHLFETIRSRWHMTILPQSQAIRALLNKEHQPWAFGFIADQRPRTTGDDNWLMFLNHETAFITGPEDIGNRVGADFIYLDVERPKRGYYILTFKKLHADKDTGEKYPVTREFWKEFEATIKRDPALWLWSHKRWKFARKETEVQ